MKKIALSQGKFTLVDDSDYEWLMQWRWHYGGNKYAVRSVRSEGKGLKVYLHREVAHAKKGEITDHINRNRLDNRKKNLRKVTYSQNRRNTGAKGYHWHKVNKKWHANIRINGKKKFIGSFTNKKDARKAYLIEYKKCFE